MIFRSAPNSNRTSLVVNRGMLFLVLLPMKKLVHSLIRMKIRFTGAFGLFLIAIQGVLCASGLPPGTGQVAAWGDLNYDLTIVPSRPATRAVAGISAGSFHSLVLQGDGTLMAWGDNQFGQTSIPGSAQRGGVVEAVAGNVHNLALLSNGTVIAWGASGGAAGDYGQCDVPAGLNGVVAVAAGAVHSLALRGDGTVVA